MKKLNDSKKILALSKPILECGFCRGTGQSTFIDMNDDAIPFGRVDWDKYGKTDKCPDCNGSGFYLKLIK